MRWKRLCFDVDTTGTIRGASIEWHEEAGELTGPEAITVLPFFEQPSVAEIVVALLAVPWYEPELPFPDSGSVFDANALGQLPEPRVSRGVRP